MNLPQRPAATLRAAKQLQEQGDARFILERFVQFTRELSVLAVRGRTGETAVYPLVENHHRVGILRLSMAPAPRLDAAIQRAAEQAAHSVIDEIQYVGVLAIEFFEQGGRLLANEMAPRVHNSGHWTIEGAVTSQFENHLRAVVGLPLGSPHAIGSSAMLNLIGEVPDSAEVLAIRDAHLHLYGKSPRAGRKLGHVSPCARHRRSSSLCGWPNCPYSLPPPRSSASTQCWRGRCPLAPKHRLLAVVLRPWLQPDVGFASGRIPRENLFTLSSCRPSGRMLRCRVP